ncbi:hypothetical protein [Aliarcobacter butzleri]|uniref:hypothetical protein n=1 Tax=Aliarcobacter butzleri TaxID=28197 RepID=UPI00263D7C94|nr:hypothetical protein [Aliarcobacter butzleri]MDN5130000.1 hypothetical protein [Aliarcobacter butzleri]
MKKIVFGVAMSLAILLTGCGENTENIKGKEEFIKSAEFDFNKARNKAEQEFGKDTVQKWINENTRLKDLEKQYKEFDNRKGKHIDYTNFDWSVGTKKGEK